MKELHDVFNRFIETAKAHEEAVTRAQDQIDAIRAELHVRETELIRREELVTRRENGVANIRQLAASRKAEVEAALDQANKAHEARKKAESELRIQVQNNLKLRAALAAVLPANQAVLQANQEQAATCDARV